MRCLYDGPHPCGKCPACMANRQRAFMFRLDQEKENCTFYFWLTLQYDDEHVPRLESKEMCFSKEHCRKFFEKLRSRYDDDGITFRHFLVAEYGSQSTRRPHYHCLLLCYLERGDINRIYAQRSEIREFLIEKAWPYGHVTEKSYHGRVLSYLTKYCMKPEMIGQYHTMKPFTLISRGIGLSYLDKIDPLQLQQMKDKLDFTVRYGNSKIELPRYYKDKILSHSLQNLRDLIPTTPEDEDSWSDYNKMKNLRDKFEEKQCKLIKRRAKIAQNRERTIEQIRNQIDSRERIINTTWNNFAAVVKNRKDL